MPTSIQSRFLRPARFNRLGKGVTYFGLAALLAMTAMNSLASSGAPFLVRAVLLPWPPFICPTAIPRLARNMITSLDG